MPELWELAAEEIGAQVRAREVSAAEVLESCLARTAAGRASTVPLFCRSSIRTLPASLASALASSVRT